MVTLLSAAPRVVSAAARADGREIALAFDEKMAVIAERTG